LAALRDASHQGFGDIEEGRLRDISDDGLDDYLAGLGRRAGDTVHGG
jgi:antitoxin ParD1/3/4